MNSVKVTVQKANPFDTVMVRAGRYHEYDIHITKPITIIGEGQPIIDGDNKGEIISIYSDSVSVMGLTVMNVGTSYTIDYAAIRVVESKYFHIEEVQLENLFFGIYLEKANVGSIINNRILGVAKDEYNSGNGIHLWYSHKVKIDNNHIEGVRDGIYLEFSDSIIITHNVSRENLRYGLHFMFSNNDHYENNIFERNGAGVAVMFSKGIVMVGNTFRNNWGPTSYGLLLKEINDAKIIGNHFFENTTAVNIEGSNRIEYTGNTFESNGWAIKVLGACYTNVLEKITS